MRRPLDARREPVQRMAVLHGAVQRDGAARLAKRSAGLDVSSVSVIRFTWDGGWVDSGSTTSVCIKRSRSDRRGRLPARSPIPADRRPDRLAQARALCASIYMPAPTPSWPPRATSSHRAARLAGRRRGRPVRDAAADATLIVGTPAGAFGLRAEDIDDASPLFALSWMAPGGFVVDNSHVGARRAWRSPLPDEVAVLYGVFHLLRHLQTDKPSRGSQGRSGPRFGLRMLITGTT